MNTLITLMYRDAANYKSFCREVVRGEITAEQLAAISPKLEDGCMLIAEAVGLPTPSFLFEGKDDFPNDDIDHVFTTLCAVEDGDAPKELHTAEAPTLDMSVDELVAAIVAINEWPIGAEWDRMFGAPGVDGPNVRRLRPSLK